MGKYVRRSASLCVGFCVALTACDPIPDQLLSRDAKEADMKWLYSQFDANYAPLDYKAARAGFEYQALKKQYLEDALATEDNESFYRLVHRFVAQFQDAHTGVSFSYGDLPQRATLSYLGFSGKRKGDRFLVTEILSTFDMDKSSFPVQVGDEISDLDGKPLIEWIKEQTEKTRDLGQSEANLTYHMNRLFNRVSVAQGAPRETDAVLTIAKRVMSEDEREALSEAEDRVIPQDEKKEVKLEVKVPWIAKDVYEFKKDLQQTTSSVNARASTEILDIFRLGGSSSDVLLGLRGFDGQLQGVANTIARLSRGMEGYHFLDSFYFADAVESWTMQVATDSVAATTLDQLKSSRSIPKSARFVTEESAVYPTYVTRESGSDGKKLVATLYLNTFSPKGKREKVVTEVKKTLETLQLFGVRKLVIDMVNNGGGSLALGMQLAQVLSNKKVEMPSMQFRTSQTWRDEFLSMSLNAPSDAEKALAKRVYNQLQTDMKSGKRLSDPINAEVLLPFELTPNTQLEENFEVVLMVNEMCASMCDIFTAILKDNHLAKVVGSKTMGAGGNVVNHFQAPNSHFQVQQTESLVVRNIPGQGATSVASRYIENQGVVPDVELNVSDFTDQKYKAVRDRAVKLLME